MLGMNWCYISWVSRRFNSGPGFVAVGARLRPPKQSRNGKLQFLYLQRIGPLGTGRAKWLLFRNNNLVPITVLAPSHGHKASDLRIWGRSPAHMQTTVGLIHIFVAHPLIWNPAPSPLFPSVHHPSTLHHAVRNPFTFENDKSTAKGIYIYIYNYLYRGRCSTSVVLWSSLQRFSSSILFKTKQYTQ